MVPHIGFDHDSTTDLLKSVKRLGFAGHNKAFGHRNPRAFQIPFDIGFAISSLDSNRRGLTGNRSLNPLLENPIAQLNMAGLIESNAGNAPGLGLFDNAPGGGAEHIVFTQYFQLSDGPSEVKGLF